MGAILLSVLIVCLWLRTAYHEFQLLIGVTADTPMLQHLTYIGEPHFVECYQSDSEANGSISSNDARPHDSLPRHCSRLALRPALDR